MRLFEKHQPNNIEEERTEQAKHQPNNIEEERTEQARLSQFQQCDDADVQ